MQRLTITNNKGGVGKTSISTIIARYANNDKKVLLIDFDVQGNATSVLSDFVEADKKICTYDLFTRALTDQEIAWINDTEHLFVVGSDLRLANTDSLNPFDCIKICVENFKKLKVDLIIIDTSPTLSNALVIATGISKDILIPIEPSRFSFDGVQAFIKQILNNRAFLTKNNIPCQMRFMGMVVNKMEYGKKRRTEMLNQIRETFKQYVFNTVIGNRDAVAEAMDRSLDLRELKSYSSKKSIIEFNALYAEIMERLHE